MGGAAGVGAAVRTAAPRVSLGAVLAAAALVNGGPALADHDPDVRAVAAASGTVTSDRARAITATDLLRLAESQVGVAENAQGGGTPFHAWYMSSQRARETVARDGGKIHAYANAPWCAMFVSWVGEKAGLRSTVGWDAYTVTHAGWFEANGRWGTTPRPGAVVFFDWDGGSGIDAIDHVGLVKQVNGDGTITTIEGNTGNGKVERRVRPVSQVIGYGYPEYAP